MRVPDQIARCVLGGSSVRVVAACTTETAREAARRHSVVGVPAVALARATTAGVLIATLTKDEERLTLQISGDGPLGAVTVDSCPEGVRAFLKNATVQTGGAPGMRVQVGGAVGRKGIVTVIRDVGLKEPFSGRTAIVDGEIDTDVEEYLTSSEQVESALACEALLADDLDIAVSAGVLIQSLPGSKEALLVASWRDELRHGLLSSIVASAGEQPSADDLAMAVLGPLQADLRVLDVRPVQFYCPCSRERAASTLALLGHEDLATLIREEKSAAVTCHFCRETYRFSEEELERIRAELSLAAGRPVPS